TFAIDGNTYDVVEPRLQSRLAIVQIRREVQPVGADRHEPAVIVGEINPDRIAGKNDEVPSHKRLFAGIVLRRPLTGNRRDKPRPRIEAANPVRLRVGDIHDVVFVERDGCRPCQIDFERGAVPVETMLPGSHHSGDDAGFSINFADAIAAGITDIEIVAGIKRDIERKVETSFAAEAVIPAITGLADTGEIAHWAFLHVDAPDAVGPA